MHSLNRNKPVSQPQNSLATAPLQPSTSTLPPMVLQKMQQSFGADFSRVRIHEDGTAASVGALAVTQGNDIYFAAGKYQPFTRHGQRLLAHELTHVLQQRQGRVHSPPGVQSPLVIDPALEKEADRASLLAEKGRPVRLAGAQPKMASRRLGSPVSKMNAHNFKQNPQNQRGLNGLQNLLNMYNIGGSFESIVERIANPSASTDAAASGADAAGTSAEGAGIISELVTAIGADPEILALFLL